ncbi:hypothetical protein PVK06_039371 [Gossypium arboreum]|uniref:Uncharacterized protein n=1 Tax=Gossypium arboreum TaxID=29729 RepID=A0ABR0N3B8_GOSAR|nr:hypothetical protein PVK06_039371 [Gossypium arboreum]
MQACGDVCMLIEEEGSIEGDYARVVIVTKNNVESSKEANARKLKVMYLPHKDRVLQLI